MKKRILALVLATTMVAGSAVTAFADEGSGSGQGDVEGIVETNVFSVVLPTVASDADTFAFILDPQGLIAATENAAYASDAEFGEGNLFFRSAEKVYGDTSAALTAINKSSFDVEISLTATLENYDGLTVAASDTDVADETNPAIYLALKNEAGEVDYDYAGSDPAAPVAPEITMTDSAGATAISVADGKAAASVTATLAAPAADSADKAPYVYSYDADEGYSYILNDAWTGKYKGVAFALTGAINTYDPTAATTVAGWKDLAEIAPSVEVVWSIENPTLAPTEAAPSITTNSVAWALGVDTEVGISLGVGDLAATGISSVSYMADGKKYTFTTSQYSLSDGKLILSHSKTDAWLNAGVTSRVVTVTFNDEAATTATVTLTKE